MWNLVERIIQVQEGYVHLLVLLLVFLHQQPNSVDGISGTASLYKIALVGRDGDNAPKALV